MAHAGQVVGFAFPGDLNTRTGGYVYDARVIAELEGQGWCIEPVSLPSAFPFPKRGDLAESAARLRALPAGMPLIVDGLALGAMPEIAAEIAQYRRLVALVHHPLALETGLDAGQAADLRASECAALACADAVIVTSPTTRATLITDYAVPEANVRVALPGNDIKPLASAENLTPRLLAVGTITPRKDFSTLIKALARLRGLTWQLTIAGALDRDPACLGALQVEISAAEIADRVRLAGELVSDELDAAYRQADLFVASSRYEGYGMAMMDAVAYGLPVVATAAGAVPEVLPRGAGELVDVGDDAALAEAVGRFLAIPEYRKTVLDGARRAREHLPRWDEAARVFAEVIGP